MAFVWLIANLGDPVRAAEPRLEFTRMVAHWAEYADAEYLPFIDDAKPEIAQVGFYGAHFWSLSDTAFGGGYPAHLPVRGHRECAEWLSRLNAELHRRGVKVIGHFNVKFLVGDPESPEGPRGFFRSYQEWDTERLGPRPQADALDLLEKDKDGKPISSQSYSIGGMREYWACLNNPAWREVLKAWVRFAIANGVDGFVSNYFYRHDCRCRHCEAAFRRYLGDRFTAAELKDRFAIADLATHKFDEIGSWHDPAASTPLRREALRFSQIANKEAFDEVLIKFGRSLKPDLIAAQWNHIGDFNQVSGDERCFLPDDRWGRGEDYLWYSTGGATNATDLAAGVLGEATLIARYIRGAFDDKPFTLGRYESVRIRSAIAELAANGGAPMGFYTSFKDPEARREIVRYYGFLRRHEKLFKANRSHAEALLLFPRRRVHEGDVAAVARFKDLGRRLLDAHVLFDVLPDDRASAADRARYAAVFDVSEAADAAGAPADLRERLPAGSSTFGAPAAVRVSASRPAEGEDLCLHFVNYNREEPSDKKAAGSGIKDEKPVAAPAFQADVLLPTGTEARRAELLTPEEEAPRELSFERRGNRIQVQVPPFLVYAVLRLELKPAAKSAGLGPRVPWTESRVAGSPDPPAPYAVERTFANIKWKSPIYIAAEPGTDSLLFVQQGSDKDHPSRVLRVRDDPGADQTETLLELKGWMIYGVAFHPGYAENGQLFVFNHGPEGAPKLSNRISRFKVGRDAERRCEASSEEVIIDWRSEGHDGGDMVFGHDRMLYITTGDGTADSDGWVTGQDLSDLLGGVLRIDVDHPDASKPYSVPADNPFVSLKDARPELWAYGLRNPWRLAIDRKTGAIWAGNNGQDMWETAHLIRRGENYGWSVYEGRHPFYLQRRLGPTPPVPPTIEHHHADFRSLTGGTIYYGDKLPDLEGAYVYGDYSTGKIWGARHDGKELTWHRELVDTSLQVTAFAVGHNGDLLVADHGSGIFRIIPAPKGANLPPFPVRLGDTGLFRSVKDHEVHPGLIPYAVNAQGWVDGASAERYIGLPGDGRIDYSTGTWGFPDGTVLMQTLSLEGEPARPASRRRIETRLLTRQQGEWIGYSYRWNEEGTEAALAGAQGEDLEIPLRDSRAQGGQRRIRWRIPSRSECMACHSRAANYVLGLTELQMNRELNYDGSRENQIEALERAGEFKEKAAKPAPDRPRLVDPYDPAQELEARARSYLHVNCSVCHVEAGGGNSKMELGFNTARERMGIFDARPQHDIFGVRDAMIVAPGDPDRSILRLRISRRGPGQMPPLVRTAVDEGAARLMHDWIKSMKPQRKFVKDWQMDDLVPSLDELSAGRSFDSGRAAFRDSGCAQCHRLAGEGGSVGPALDGIGRRLSARDVLESLIQPSKVIAPEYANTQLALSTGEVLFGRVEQEDASSIMLRPLATPEKSVAVSKASVRSRSPLQISNMPDGVLNTLEKSQILDLLAYLLADAKADAPAFR